MLFLDYAILIKNDLAFIALLKQKGVLLITMYQSFKKASVWAIIWRGILFVLAFILFLTILLVASPLFLVAFDALLMLGIYIIGYFLVVKQVRNQGFSYDSIKGQFSWNTQEALKIAGITAILALFASTMPNPLLLLIDHLGWFNNELFLDLFTLLLLEETNPWALLNLFFVAVVAAPIVEELFFRGFILNKWSEKHSMAKGIFWSSFFFMIVHMPSLFIPQLLVGVWCALVYVKTKQLLYPILVHAFYNFLVFLPALYDFFTGTTTSEEESIQQAQELVNPSAETIQEYWVFTAICGVALLATLALFKWYGNHIRKEATPYVANFDSAADVQEYEENRSPTEEEMIAQWEAEQEVDSENSFEDDNEER